MVRVRPIPWRCPKVLVIQADPSAKVTRAHHSVRARESRVCSELTGRCAKKGTTWWTRSSRVCWRKVDYHG